MYRFAPSPTGDMHIGNLRTAILNFIAAKQSGKGFILRIEDTDKARNIDGKEKEIFEILEIFGISWDQLYYQSKNLKFHREFAHKLLLEKKAFCCFCSESELEMKKEKAKKDGVAYRYDGTCEKLSDEEVLNCEKPFVIRMKKPNSNVKFKDEIKGEFEFSSEAVDSFVIMRADKTPTYNFACGVDDMLMDIDFIIRGEDHVSNTPKQEWIRESLGYKKSITYAHLPIILNENGKKMSKRESDSSVKFLLKKGYLPEAIANYLILLGNKTPCEIFTIAEAIEWFDIKNISKSPAKFDIKRLDQLNRAHILRASDERISEIFGLDKKYADLVKFYTQESSLVSEIKEKIFKIHSQTKDFGEFETEAKILRDEILKMEIPLNFDEFKSYLMSATNLKGKRFFMPLRVLLTGSSHGPELSELYPLIRDEIKENI